MDSTSVVARFREVLDDAANLPISTLGTDEVTAWMVELRSIRARVSALTCQALSQPPTAAGSAAQTGHRSVADLIATETGENPRALRDEAGLGVWLTDFPVLADAFGAGRLSEAHVRAIRTRENPRTRPHLADAQSYLVEAAGSCQWNEFLAVLRYWELAADPDGIEPNDQTERRAFNYSRHADGTLTGRFTLDPVAGQALTSVVEHHLQRLFRADAESGIPRTSSQRRADALLQALTGRRGARPNALIHVVVGEAVVADHFARLGDPERQQTPLPVEARVSEVLANWLTALRSTPDMRWPSWPGPRSAGWCLIPHPRSPTSGERSGAFPRS